MRWLAVLSLVALCTVSTVYCEQIAVVEMEEGSPDAPPPPPELSETDLALVNVSQAATSTIMRIENERADTYEDVEGLKVAAEKAVENQALDEETVQDIERAAEEIERALELEDQEIAKDKAEELGKAIDQAVIKERGADVAERLNTADEKNDEPVLSDEEEEAILRAAVKDVIDHDDKIPEEKRDEAVEYTVKAMTEGLESAGTTNEEFVGAVEREAANLDPEELTANATATDRHFGYYGYYSYPAWYYWHRFGGYPWWGRGYGWGRWWWRRRFAYGKRRKRSVYYGLYSPYYYRGYGYRQCLYWFSYPYCRRRLYSDYLYYHPFHRFYRRYSYYYG